mgnify:CR=1 FL=1
MRVAMFSTKPYDRRSFEERNEGHAITYFEPRLSAQTASLADGFPAICLFVNDEANAAAIARLAQGGTRLIALRCAGFNNVDLAAAERHGIAVARVPAYSPHAVAEFTVGLMLSLVRNIHRAYQRTRDNNYALDGLLGFDLHGSAAGLQGLAFGFHAALDGGNRDALPDEDDDDEHGEHQADPQRQADFGERGQCAARLGGGRWGQRGFAFGGVAGFVFHARAPCS